MIFVVIPFDQPAKRPDYGTYQLLHLGHETKERGNGSWQRKRGIHWGNVIKLSDLRARYGVSGP